MAAEVDVSPDVCYVIISYNTRDLLLQCIASLLAPAPEGPSCEIVVVDNASNDESAEAVRVAFPQVQVIESRSNLGFGRAANLGAKATNARYVAILNPDTKVRPEAMVYLLRQLQADGTIGALSCRIQGIDGQTQISCARFPTPLRIFALFSRLDLVLHGPNLETYYGEAGWNHDSPRNVDTLLGAFFVMPTQVFRKVQGFDERYFMYFEEVDLFRETAKAGYRTRFDPTVSIVHYGGEATRQDYAKMRFEQQRSLLIYLRKWHGRLGAWLIHLMLIILASFRLVWSIFFAPFFRARREHRGQLRTAAWSLLEGLLKPGLYETKEGTFYE